MKAIIFDIKRFAVHDGDGIRSTVFFKGCPLRCVWCHNPEGISPKPQLAFYAHKCLACGACRQPAFTAEDCPGEARIPYGRETTVEKLLSRVLEDAPFYAASGGGVTLSGGECLMQARFCAELLKELKKRGVHTAVDTCGFVCRSELDRVVPYTDLFLYDIKAYDEDVHIRCTGSPNALILENLAYLDSIGKDVEIRIPYVPDRNADQMEKIARFLAPLHHITKIRILPYHDRAGSKYAALQMENTLPSRLPTDEELNAAKRILSDMTQLTVTT